MGAKTMFQNPAPEVLERKSGGGCLRLFGLPFFLAGLFIAQIPLGIIPVSNQDELPGWMMFFLPLFAMPFIAVGGALLFGSKTLVIDRSRNLAVVSWKLLVPVRRREYRLDEFSVVSLRKDLGDSDTPTTFPVELRSATSAAILNIDKPQSYPDARSLSEQLARFLKLPLEDESSGEKVVREHDRLDESLAVRARRTGEKVELPAMPPFMRSSVEQAGRQLVVTIPASSFGLQDFISMSVVLGIGLYLLAGIYGSEFPLLVKYRWPAMALIALLALAVGLLPRLRKLQRKIRVIASPDELRVEEHLGFRVKVQVIPGEELEELSLPKRHSLMGTAFQNMPAEQLDPMLNYGAVRLPDGKPVPRWLLVLNNLVKSQGIIARSDKTELQFGAGLSDQELAYLCALIKKAMVE